MLFLLGITLYLHVNHFSIWMTLTVAILKQMIDWTAVIWVFFTERLINLRVGLVMAICSFLLTIVQILIRTFYLEQVESKFILTYVDFNIYIHITAYI